MVETRNSSTFRVRSRPILKNKRPITTLKKPPHEKTPTSKRRKELEQERVEEQSGNTAKAKKKRVEAVVAASNEPEPVADVAISNEQGPEPEISELATDVAISDEEEPEPGIIESVTEGAMWMTPQPSASQRISGSSLGASDFGLGGGEGLGAIEPKKVIHFNEKGQPIGEGSATFTTKLGSIMRKHCPISYEKWLDVPDQTKNMMWKLITDKYIIPVAYKRKILERILNYWRSYKSVLRSKHYDRYDTDAERKMNCPKGVRQDVWDIFVVNQSKPDAQARRKAGKIARQAMKTPHVSGRTGAARTAEALKKGNPFATVTRTDLYLAMHSRKDGSCPTPELTNKVEQIKAIALQDPSSIHLDVDHDPVAQVYGPEKKSFVRGMGIGVTKSTLLHSAPVVDQLQQERRLRLFAEDQIVDLREQVVSQGSAPADNQFEERRFRVSAEEQITVLRQQLVSQRDQIDQLQQERMSRLSSEAQLSDLREQVLSQGLMIADLKEQITRLYS